MSRARDARVLLAAAVHCLILAAGQWAHASTAPSASPPERTTYSLHYVSGSWAEGLAGAAGAGAGAGPAVTRQVSLDLVAELVVTRVGGRGDGALLAYSCRRPRVSIRAEGMDTGTLAAGLEADLRRDVLVTADGRGRVRAVSFAPESGMAARHLVGTLLGLTQFVLPPEGAPRAPSWDVREEAPDGLYRSRYQHRGAEPGEREGSGTARYWKTRRPAGLPGPAPGTPAPPRDKVTGRLAVEVDAPSHRVLTMAGTEVREQSVAGRTLSRSSQTVRLVRIGAQPTGPEDVAALLRVRRARLEQGLERPLHDPSRLEQGAAEVQRQELQGDTIETLTARLAVLEASPEAQEREASAIFLKLKALALVHPETSGRLGEVLAGARLHGRTAPVVAGALSAAGHAQAQSALVAALRRRTADDRALLMIIPALGFVAGPTAEAEGYLYSLAADARRCDVAYTAQLALGTMVRSLSGPAPVRSEDLARRLVSLDRGTCRAPVRQLILVLGNAGSRTALPILRRHATGPDPVLRAAAVSALRWLPSAGADAILVHALTKDSDPAVRAAAAVALSYRPARRQSLRAARSALLGDPAEAVRLAALHALWPARGAAPEIRSWVGEAARSDPAKDVREAAGRLLSSAS